MIAKFRKNFKRGWSKRGSHVDVVISFVIFIIFLGFLYSIIGPSTGNTDKESVLDYLEKEVTDRLSANLTTASLRINKGIIEGVYDCFEICHIIPFEGVDILVKDTNNAIVEFNPSTEGRLCPLRIDATLGKRNFKVYYSDEELQDLPLDGEDCTFQDGTFYSESSVEDLKTIGLTRTEKYVFEEKVKRILNNKTAYEELKDSLKIPFGQDFGFDFVDENGERTYGEVKKILKDTYIREVPINYVDFQANIKTGFVVVKLW